MPVDGLDIGLIEFVGHVTPDVLCRRTACTEEVQRGCHGTGNLFAALAVHALQQLAHSTDSRRLLTVRYRVYKERLQLLVGLLTVQACGVLCLVAEVCALVVLFHRLRPVYLIDPGFHLTAVFRIGVFREELLQRRFRIAGHRRRQFSVGILPAVFGGHQRLQPCGDAVAVRLRCGGILGEVVPQDGRFVAAEGLCIGFLLAVRPAHVRSLVIQEQQYGRRDGGDEQRDGQRDVAVLLRSLSCGGFLHGLRSGNRLFVGGIVDDEVRIYRLFVRLAAG